MDAALLQCIICPGKPRFSDVSHLLTHVASKAHLAHYFKLQVRSHQEVEALELLQEYDAWYNGSNLAQLLSDRLTSKEIQRKKRKSRGPLPSVSSVQPAPKINPMMTPRANCPDANTHFDAAIPNFLDPRLVGAIDRVKHELNAAGPSFMECYVTPGTSSAVLNSGGVEKVEKGQGSSMPAVDTMFGENRRTQAENPAERYHVDLPETPKPRRHRDGQSDVTLTIIHKSPDPFVDDGDVAEVTDEVEIDKERADEMARLKGILWPGMDIFDSATQQMRRKRNQKKDGNVLRMMEMTSLQVEPTELVFSPTGVLRKQRLISGNVEDDSPLKGETPIPKRRASRPKREALQQADENVSRTQDRRRGKRTDDQRHIKVNLDSMKGNSKATSGAHGLTGLMKSHTGGDRDSELALSVQAFGKRPRTAFAVFADEDDRNKLENNEARDQQMQSKFPRETLTPARLVLGHKSENQNFHGCKTIQAPLDKENIEPILSTQGRIDLQNWHSPMSSALVSGFFLDESSGGSLMPGNDHFQSGYISNPLLAPTSKLGFYEKSPYEDDDTAPDSTWMSLSRAVSSEATISEEDQHELARLYLAGGVE